MSTRQEGVYHSSRGCCLGESLCSKFDKGAPNELYQIVAYDSNPYLVLVRVDSTSAYRAKNATSAVAAGVKYEKVKAVCVCFPMFHYITTSKYRTTPYCGGGRV